LLLAHDILPSPLKLVQVLVEGDGMLVLRHGPTRDTELRGTPAELTHLANLLISGFGSVDLDNVDDPSPYGRSLSRINVVQTSGPVAMTCAAGSDELDIRGGSPQLNVLAANVQGFADERDATSHLHIDYFPGHDYLDGSSEPLVIGLTG
jgi:hypothetical protein